MEACHETLHYGFRITRSWRYVMNIPFITNFFEKQKNKFRDSEYNLISKEFPHIKKEDFSMLIRYSKEKYVVYLNRNNEMDWVIYNGFESKDEVSGFNRIFAKINWLQQQPSMSYLSEKTKMQINMMLGNCLCSALDASYDIAGDSLKYAEKFIEDRKIEISRKWQLQYSFLISLLISAVLLTLNAFSALIAYYFKLDAALFDNIKYLQLSVIGALFSVILGMGRSTYNCDSGRMQNFLEILSRMTAGLISGGVVVILYRIDLIFATFRKIESYDILLILSFIAGFSERLISSVLQKITSQASDEQKTLKEAVETMEKQLKIIEEAINKPEAKPNTLDSAAASLAEQV